MTDSWIIAAIERAALERARQELASGSISIFGMNPEQIHALRCFFKDHTGEWPDRLSPGGIKETRIK